MTSGATTESKPKATKSFPVFDCDAHIVEPAEVCESYVPESEKELVQGSYWFDKRGVFIVNGQVPRVPAGSGTTQPGFYDAVDITGPQVDKKIIRKLIHMAPLSAEQRDYLKCKGNFDPGERIKDLDLMGIDQVLVIPTMLLMTFPFVKNPEGAAAYCRAYNNWLRDWCDVGKDRLWGAAVLPMQSGRLATEEVYRVAELGHPVGLVRPMDGLGRYPNAINSDLRRMMGGGAPNYDRLYRAFEDTGVCLGMHTFPTSGGVWAPFEDRHDRLVSPGQLIPLTASGADGQTLSFIFEAQTWLAQVLLSGFLDRYPRLKMLLFESNSQWLPEMLETCDRMFKLYANEREVPAKRLPSEAFYEQCAISFEGDEVQTFRQWENFENIGLWSSDCYHHDAADAWSAIGDMREANVPEDVMAKLMGGNARKFYGIEPKTFVTEEPGPIARPDWYPQGPELDEFAQLVAYPRENAAILKERGWDMESVKARLAASYANGNGTNGASAY